VGKACTTYMRDDKCSQFFSRKRIGRRYWHRWKDNIKMDFSEMHVNWIQLAHVRVQCRDLVNTTLNTGIS